MDFIVPYEYKTIFSTEFQSNQINKIILKFVDKNSIITDATACIGGNSYFFAKDFKSVNSIEINNNVLEILNFNLKRFNNIKIYTCSFNIIKFILKQDVIFIDPPWGGSKYKNKKKIDLYLDDLNIIDIIDSLYNYTKIVALKVPNNFNKSNISDFFWKNKTFSINNYEKSIYKLIIFYKRT